MSLIHASERTISSRVDASHSHESANLTHDEKTENDLRWFGLRVGLENALKVRLELCLQVEDKSDEPRSVVHRPSADVIEPSALEPYHS